MANTAAYKEFVSAVATEMASGVEMAVECWMAQFEEAFTNTRLTTLGRLNAVGEILDQYKRLTGKTQLECRRVSAIARS